MLQMITAGLATVVGGPGAGAVVGSAGGSFLSGLESKWFGGDARDQQRETRARLLGEYGAAGSVRAARIVRAAPDNVASNEDQYWFDAASRIRSARPDVWEAAVNAGSAGAWPVGAPFDMPNEIQAIKAELAQLGVSAPTGVIGTVAPTTNLQVGLGQAVQNVGSQIVNNAAQAINPQGNYATIPTNKNTLMLYGVVAAVVVLALLKRSSSE